MSSDKIDKQKEEERKEEGFWLLLFALFPAILLPNFSDLFAEGASGIFVSAALGGIGAAIGFGCYSLTKGRKRGVKILTFLILLLLIIGVIYFMM